MSDGGQIQTERSVRGIGQQTTSKPTRQNNRDKRPRWWVSIHGPFCLLPFTVGFYSSSFFSPFLCLVLFYEGCIHPTYWPSAFLHCTSCMNVVLNTFCAAHSYTSSTSCIVFMLFLSPTSQSVDARACVYGETFESAPCCLSRAQKRIAVGPTDQVHL